MLMKQNEISRLTRIILGAIPFIVVLSLWVFLSYGKVVEQIFLPSPTAVLYEFKVLISTGFAADILASIGRVMGGFLISTVIAVPLGIMMGASRRIEEIFSPFVAFFRYLPAAAFIPLLILWVGIGDVQKVALLFIGIFFYLTTLVVHVVATTRKEFIDAASTLGATRLQILLNVIVPASLPGIYDALRTMMGVGWTYIVVAEMVAATSGIGKVIIESQRFLQTGKVIVGIVVIGVIGIVFDVVFRIGRPLLFRWASIQ